MGIVAFGVNGVKHECTSVENYNSQDIGTIYTNG
ncbi:uncharacterized protein G2W53_016231 [Senna tora]|uniref:Uncharacterized protein n=1 Tax=Senna tora TaxID=362788 RepID=A0A834WJE1_9FABA|nr:uncharacterized protein G2W53_016231 [Senna tora]